MVKLVDALDSKSSGPCDRASSSLASGTSKFKGLSHIRDSPFFCCRQLSPIKWGALKIYRERPQFLAAASNSDYCIGYPQAVMVVNSVPG